MSAYIVSNETITAIVQGLQRKEFSSSLTDPETMQQYNARTNPQMVGQILLNQNYKSVNYRYNEDAKPRKFTMTYRVDEKGYRDDYTLAEIYGSIRCYTYQACENPEWHDSEIDYTLRALKDDLAEKMAEKLGEEMPWGIK